MRTRIRFRVFLWKNDRWWMTGLEPGDRLTGIRPDHMNNDLRCYYDIWVLATHLNLPHIRPTR